MTDRPQADRRPPDGPPSGPAVPTIVITCAVMEDEIAHFAAQLDHIVHIELMEQGLHNDPPELQRRVQAAIIDLEQRFPDAGAIVLGYGLCSRGTEGLIAERCKLVIARAHDCITLLLGDRKRYAEYVAENPGTYWYSPGWNRHHTPPGQERYEKLHKQYLEKYGEDNAQFLMESEQHWFSTYKRATFVELTVGGNGDDVEYTRRCADWLGWQFDHQAGDPGLLKALLGGDWDDDRFVVLEPGQTFRMTADERVVEPTDP